MKDQASDQLVLCSAAAGVAFFTSVRVPCGPRDPTPRDWVCAEKTFNKALTGPDMDINWPYWALQGPNKALEDFEKHLRSLRNKRQA